MKGFLTPSDVAVKKRLPLLAQCGLCKLDKGCESPKMAVVGKGKKEILVIGEAPGEQEDLRGKPFVGPAGELLQKKFRKFGFDLFEDAWVTNACICRPPDNELPEQSIAYCRPNVVKAIKTYKPKVIILLGAVAVQSVIGWLWKEDPGGVSRWVGWNIPCQSLNAWICPTFHPSWVMRSDKEQEGVATLFFEKHLSKALGLSNRPWKTVPEYAKKVQCIKNHVYAGEALEDMVATNPIAVAFDYETDRLKPDSEDAQIICCSVSNGDYSIAYPWLGDTVKATQKILASSIPKIGYNLKFEHRWSKRVGYTLNNWIWDGMLAAHVLDNRPHICGLKFQAFVNLGQESYDDTVKPYLKSNSANGVNRIKEVNLDKLLLYCGMDSLLEYKIAALQMRELGADYLEERGEN